MASELSARSVFDGSATIKMPREWAEQFKAHLKKWRGVAQASNIPVMPDEMTPTMVGREQALTPWTNWITNWAKAIEAWTESAVLEDLINNSTEDDFIGAMECWATACKIAKGYGYNNPILEQIDDSNVHGVRIQRNKEIAGTFPANPKLDTVRA